jgi:hypothetical protein
MDDERVGKMKWNVRFTAEYLALLLVLWQQVEKEKKEAHEMKQTTRTALWGFPRHTNMSHF